ncbi:hypothetical protein HOL34_01105 [bacterium]|jgi:hypothetical protein|nr:hypothetical protein [bacterium]MBT3903889.1 hypothetical protein [bacterium]MBT4577894.1 hypothetical protein [bacterium]MBT5345685.1 hypothetical protein [bacterium]MBT6131270.1 hypothetical protein [bacterium]
MKTFTKALALSLTLLGTLSLYTPSANAGRTCTDTELPASKIHRSIAPIIMIKNIVNCERPLTPQDFKNQKLADKVKKELKAQKRKDHKQKYEVLLKQHKAKQKHNDSLESLLNVSSSRSFHSGSDSPRSLHTPTPDDLHNSKHNYTTKPIIIAPSRNIKKRKRTANYKGNADNINAANAKRKPPINKMFHLNKTGDKK